MCKLSSLRLKEKTYRNRLSRSACFAVFWSFSLSLFFMVFSRPLACQIAFTVHQRLKCFCMEIAVFLWLLLFEQAREGMLRGGL